MQSQLKYFIYARKSTDDDTRQQASIEDQVSEVRALAARQGLVVTDVLIEKQSAKHPGRPVFADMIKRLERGEADGIMAWHPDRLARNAIDGGTIIYMVDTGHIKDLKFCTCPFEPNAHGKYALSMMFSHSKYYVDSLSENIRRGKRNRIKNGYWPSSAPLGYINDRTTRTLTVDPLRGPLVREMFHLYATGTYTTEALRDWMVDQGCVGVRDGKLSIARVEHALTNPFYYGVLRFKGEYHDGKHEALISQQLFDRCREVKLDRGQRKKPVFDKFLWRHTLRCGECGCGITMEVQKGHHYYRCTKKRGPCSQPYLREDRFMTQVRDALRYAGISTELAKSIGKSLREQAEGDAQAVRRECGDLKAAVAENETRTRRLNELFLEQGISVEEYRSMKNALVEAKQKHQQTLAGLQDKSSGWLEPALLHVSDAARATCIAESGSDQEASKKLKEIGSNLTLRDRWLQWQPRGAWQLLVGQRVVEMGPSGACADGSPASAPVGEEEREWSRGESNPRAETVN